MKAYLLKIITSAILIVAVYVIYGELLNSNLLPFPGSHTHSAFCHHHPYYHFLKVGLLPVYIALITLGLGAFGLYLYDLFQRFFRY